MKKNIYCFFNRLGSYYVAPMFEIYDQKNYMELLKQSFVSLDEKTVNQYAECDLYCLGAFDNVSGAFESKIDFVCHVSDLLLKKGVNENGREN